MGKGDKRTRRSKIWRGTYGKTRPRKPKQRRRNRTGAGAGGPPAPRG